MKLFIYDQFEQSESRYLSGTRNTGRTQLLEAAIESPLPRTLTGRWCVS